MSGHKVPCSICGSHSTRLAFHYEAPPVGETVFDIGQQSYDRSYYECDVCGHFSWFSEMDLGFLYDGEYVDRTYGDKMHQRFEKIIGLPKDSSDNEGRAKYLVDAVQRYLGYESVRLLDVGSGLAVFPWRMKQEGWDIVALDPDQRASDHARNVVGVDAITGSFLDSSLMAGFESFDVITFNKVLEHVPDPIAMLKQAKSRLKAGGAVYVELPDVAAKVEGYHRQEFHLEHYHVFSIASFVLLAEKAGFAVQEVSRLVEPSSKYTLRGILKT